MKHVLGLAIIAGASSVASGQAITGFTGGSQFFSYYTPTTAGDVVGYRFEVTEEITVTDLGVWNADNTGGLTAEHEIGIWDSSENLLAQGRVLLSGQVVGDWTYVSIAPITLVPGETYTAGALYNEGGISDGDNYISSATSVQTSAEVVWLNGVYPLVADLGFVFPALDSAPTSGGRFGPNFLYESGGGCYPDCTGEGDLDIFDFLCFQDAFVVMDPYADCTGEGTFDIFDFLCFQDAFVVGCP